MILRFVEGKSEGKYGGFDGIKERHYETVQLLGKGSFAEVYLVRGADSKLYAQKEIWLTHLTAKEQQRALREAKLHQTLDNPCVAQFFDSWVDRVGQTDRVCILMEYVHGSSLTSCLDQWRKSRKQVPNSLCVDWLSQITVGLMYLHSKRIVHRDLKSGNVLGPTLENVVKLGDFGTSKALLGKSVTNSIVGTPLIMAPERCRHELTSIKAIAQVGSLFGECDDNGHGFKSDMWSLGVLLYELLTLRPPFSTPHVPPQATPFVQSQIRLQLFENICRANYTPLPLTRPEDLRAMTSALLAKDPAERPSCVDLVRTFSILQRGIVTFVRRANLERHAGVVEVLEVVNDNTVSLGDLDCLTLSLRLSEGEKHVMWGTALRSCLRGETECNSGRSAHPSQESQLTPKRENDGSNFCHFASVPGPPACANQDTCLVASPDLTRCKSDASLPLPPLKMKTLRKCASELHLKKEKKRRKRLPPLAENMADDADTFPKKTKNDKLPAQMLAALTRPHVQVMLSPLEGKVDRYLPSLRRVASHKCAGPHGFLKNAELISLESNYAATNPLFVPRKMVK
eukprot:GEMP01024070.1.p1 GENE.GEMP01024070.1~~GEMP01024070.1.p1  ORF type:complete len:570 (+),score=117.04 GEMP01024070.1:455-2164(+)